MTQPQTVASPPNTLANSATDLVRQRVIAAIDRLPKLERIVLSLLYVERLTPAETGIVIAWPEVEIHAIHKRVVAELGF